MTVAAIREALEREEAARALGRQDRDAVPKTCFRTGSGGKVSTGMTDPYLDPRRTTHLDVDGESACGRSKQRHRFAGIGRVQLSDDPDEVTCGLCERHPAVVAARAARAVRAQRVGQERSWLDAWPPGTVLEGYGSTAVVVARRGDSLTIRWADGQSANIDSPRKFRAASALTPNAVNASESVAALEADVARYIAQAAMPSTREVATALGWPLKRTRDLLLGMADREFPPHAGTLAYNDIGSAASGARPGRRSPNEYVWFFT